jgi:hypothetical protein
VNLLHQRIGFGKMTVCSTLGAVLLLFAGTARCAAQDDVTATVGVATAEQFTTTAVTVNQSDGSVIVTVQLNAASADAITVQYATADGTATAPAYYTAVSGTLVFAPGDPLSQQITITLGTAVATNSTASFTVTLSNAVNAVVGDNGTVTVTIINVPPPTVQFASATYTVSESGGTAAIEVTLSAAAGTIVTVNYQTADGPSPNGAVAGTDYTATSGALTFAVGDTSQTFSVPIINHGLYALSKTVTLTLSDPSGASLGTPSTALLTIIDDDPPPDLATVAVTATGGQFSPDPAPVGTWVQATMSAQATRPTPGSDYTVSAPSWAWNFLNGQYTCPPIVTTLTTGVPGTDFSYMIVAASAPASTATYDYSAITLWASFTTAGIWQMNVNVQVSYTDTGGGTYQGQAQAGANGTEWTVDKILRSRNGTAPFLPLDQGDEKYALPGSFIVVKPRIIPNTVTATSYLWDMPPATTFKNYKTSLKNATLTLLADGDLKNEELKFYWADTGPKTVTCDVTVTDLVTGVEESHSKSGDLVVDSPTAALTAKFGATQVTGKKNPHLRFFRTDNSNRGGAAFDGKVAVPADYSEGKWYFCQRIKTGYFIWDFDNDKFKYSKNGSDWLLDLAVMYGDPTKNLNPSTPDAMSTDDSPGIPLTAR